MYSGSSQPSQSEALSQYSLTSTAKEEGNFEENVRSHLTIEFSHHTKYLTDLCDYRKFSYQNEKLKTAFEFDGLF